MLQTSLMTHRLKSLVIVCLRSLYNTQAEHAYYIENEVEWSYATNIIKDTQTKVVSKGGIKVS